MDGILIYLAIGVIVDLLVHTTMRIKKRTIPMWLAHTKIIVGWLPIVIYNLLFVDQS